MSTKTQWYISGVFALTAIGSFFVAHGPTRADGLLHVYFLNVGQGDSMLVQAPDGSRILIDGGPSQRVLQELREIIPFTDNEIEAVVATHPESDHITGLVGVLGEYDVKNIIETGLSCTSAICADLEKAVFKENARRIYARRGYKFSVGDDLIFEVLNPADDERGRILSKVNNGAIVLKMTYKGSQSVLFTADIEKPVEDRLERDYADLDVDFLKVAHHGSKTSTTTAFLEATTPIAAFIGVGAKNSYGHPSAQTLDSLDKIPGLRYYRTDIDGRIELILDGLNYAVKTAN